jgi:hypothetical protein
MSLVQEADQLKPLAELYENAAGEQMQAMNGVFPPDDKSSDEPRPDLKNHKLTVVTGAKPFGNSNPLLTRSS